RLRIQALLKALQLLREVTRQLGLEPVELRTVPPSVGVRKPIEQRVELGQDGTDLPTSFLASLLCQTKAPFERQQRRAKVGRLRRVGVPLTFTPSTRWANCLMSLTFSGCRSGTSINTLSTFATDGKAAKASCFFWSSSRPDAVASAAKPERPA